MNIVQMTVKFLVQNVDSKAVLNVQKTDFYRSIKINRFVLNVHLIVKLVKTFLVALNVITKFKINFYLSFKKQITWLNKVVCNVEVIIQDLNVKNVLISKDALNVNLIKINEMRTSKTKKMIILKKEFSIVILDLIFFIIIKIYVKLQRRKQEIIARNVIHNLGVWNVIIFKFSKESLKIQYSKIWHILLAINQNYRKN